MKVEQSSRGHRVFLGIFLNFSFKGKGYNQVLCVHFGVALAEFYLCTEARLTCGVQVAVCCVVCCFVDWSKELWTRGT